MKKTLFTVITAVILTAAAFSTGSCNLDSDIIYTSTVTFVDKSYQGYPYYFVADDSLLMIPTNAASYTIPADNGQKMEISWKTQEKDLTRDPLTIEVTGHQMTYQQTVIMSNKPDTLGDDPAKLYLLNNVVPYLYKSGGIYDAPCNLNLGFTYTVGSSAATHYVYVSYTSDPEPIDENGYFHLKFSHDANNDTQTNTASTPFSFTLPAIAYGADVKGIILDFDGMEGTPEKWQLTYATGKVENLLAD